MYSARKSGTPLARSSTTPTHVTSSSSKLGENQENILNLSVSRHTLEKRLEEEEEQGLVDVILLESPNQPRAHPRRWKVAPPAFEQTPVSVKRSSSRANKIQPMDEDEEEEEEEEIDPLLMTPPIRKKKKKSVASS
eukprot:m.87404 g.87404  ORF g.87404 m.87404 type:complete len:136 (-) comp8788_c0_seq7:91-498(-)